MHFPKGILSIFFFIVLVTGRPPVQENDIDDTMESGNEVVTFCQPQTPCAWKIYNYIDYPEITFINDYCVCRSGTTCEMHMNRPEGGYTEYRCKKKLNTSANSLQRKLNKY